MARVTHRFYQTLWALKALHDRGLYRSDEECDDFGQGFVEHRGVYPSDISSYKEFVLPKRTAESNLKALVEEGLAMKSGGLYCLSPKGNQLSHTLFSDHGQQGLEGIHPVKDWTGDKTRYKKDVLLYCTAVLSDLYENVWGAWVDISDIMKESRMSKSAIRSVLTLEMDRHSHGKEDGVSSRYMVTSNTMSISKDESRLRVNPDKILNYRPDTEETNDMTPPELLPEEDERHTRDAVSVFTSRFPTPRGKIVELDTDDTLDHIFSEDDEVDETPFTEDDLYREEGCLEAEDCDTPSIRLDVQTQRKLEALALLTGQDTSALARHFITKGIKEAARSLTLGE